MSNQDVLDILERSYAEWRQEIDENLLPPYTQAKISLEMYSKYREAKKRLVKPIATEHRQRFIEIGREILTVGFNLEEDAGS